MQFTTFALTALSLATFANAAPSKEIVPRQTPTLPCSHLTGGLHVIAASGDGANNVGNYGLLSTLAHRILKAIPGSTNVTLPYPKADSRGVYKTEVGSNNLRKYIYDYHYSCPNTRIALLGYSAGAIITNDVICGASPPPWTPTAPLDHNAYGSTIIAIVTYGDEKFVPGNPWNRGTCDTKGVDARTNSASCNPFKGKMRSWCDGNDPQCCSGFDAQVHFEYPQKYDKAATRFVKNQFARLK